MVSTEKRKESTQKESIKKLQNTQGKPDSHYPHFHLQYTGKVGSELYFLNSWRTIFLQTLMTLPPLS